MSKFPFKITGGDDAVVHGDLYTPEGEARPCPVLIFCHGFKGFKDWGGWPTMCGKLAEAGFAAIAFNFSHNGIGENFEELDRLDLFQKGTISINLEDIRAVVDAVAGKELPGSEWLDPERIGLIGHSFGGGMVLIYTTWDERIKATAGMASISHFQFFPDAAVAYAKENGFFPVLNARTGQDMPVGKDYFIDLETNRDKFSIEKAVEKIKIPLFLIHGSADETIPVANGAKLAHIGGVDLKVLNGASHTFNTAHPFAGTNQYFEEVVQDLIAFFGKSL